MDGTSRRLYDSEGIERLLAREVEAARRAGGRPLSILLVDVDDFWLLHREQGPAAAQEAVEAVERALLEGSGEAEPIGRTGRDSFLVVFPDTVVEDALIRSDLMRRRVEDTSLGSGRSDAARVTVSGGVSALEEEDQPDDLLRRAAAALHRAKRSGKNRVSLPGSEGMILKANYYTPAQLARLSALASRLGRTEASLLREALDELFKTYDT